MAAVDAASVTGPPAPAPASPCRIVQEFPFGPQPTGIDYEMIAKPGGAHAKSLVTTCVSVCGPQGMSFWDRNGPPFTTFRPMGSTAPSNVLEDITLCPSAREGDDDGDRRKGDDDGDRRKGDDDGDDGRGRGACPGKQKRHHDDDGDRHDDEDD
jgi:hypothetical protein